MLRTRSGPSYQPAQSGSVHAGAARPSATSPGRVGCSTSPTTHAASRATAATTSAAASRGEAVAYVVSRSWMRGTSASTTEGARDRRPHHGPSDGGHVASWHPMRGARHCGWHGCRETRARRTIEVCALAWLVLLVSLVLSGCTPATGDKSGGEGPVVTLSLATSDQPGGPQAPAIERFAEAVADESDGRVRVKVTYAAAGRGPQVRPGGRRAGPGRDLRPRDRARAQLGRPRRHVAASLAGALPAGQRRPGRRGRAWRSGPAAARRARGHRRPWARAVAGGAASSRGVRHPVAQPGGVPRRRDPRAVLARRLCHAPGTRQPAARPGRQGHERRVRRRPGRGCGGRCGRRLRAAGDHHGRRDALRQDRHARRRRRSLGPTGRPGAYGAHRRRAQHPRLAGGRPSARDGAARSGLWERVGRRPGRGRGGRRDRAGDLARPRGSCGRTPRSGRPSSGSRR